MNAQPLVSIALCTYNGEEFLKEQLDSLIAQTYRNLEIIVVDDCSTDSTIGILSEYADQHPLIQLFRNEKNLGYTQNFEKALRLCKGEFIAICDQDDIWLPEKISLQVDAIKTNLLIYHDSEFIDAQGGAMGLRISDKFNFYRGSDPTVFLYLNCISGHSILMKSSLLKAALPFPVGFHYDQWLAFIAAFTGSVDHLEKCLVKYRQHDKNSTDILAKKPGLRQRSNAKKIAGLIGESDWLNLCNIKTNQYEKGLIHSLYVLSVKRNDSFISLAYGWKIWKHKAQLLYLLKKPNLSKLFFTLRKTWGVPAKKLF